MLLTQRDIVLKRDVVLDGRAVVLDRADEVLVAVGDEDRLGFDRVDHVGQLFALCPVVERDEGDADLGAGVVDDHVLGRVDGHDADVIAAGQTQALQGVAQPGHFGLQIGVGLDRVFTDQGGAIGDDGGGQFEEIGGIHDSVSLARPVA